MKKLILIVLGLALLTTVSFSQTWYTANQKTIAWDAVTQLDDGSAIPAGESIRYQVFILKEGQAEEQKVNVGNTANTQYLVTLTQEGRYFIGVQSERLNSAGQLMGQSQIAWSNNATYCQGGATFGIAWFRLPKEPMNIRPM